MSVYHTGMSGKKDGIVCLGLVWASRKAGHWKGYELWSESAESIVDAC